MRTSNKILLGTFLAVLLILTSIHAAIIIKNKNGHFITMKKLHDENYQSHAIREVRSVSLTGLGNVTIVPADTAKVEIERAGDGRVHYSFENGVLTIKGDTIVRRGDNTEDRIKSYQDIIIYLPQVDQISARYCELSIHGARSRDPKVSLALQLEETDLHLVGWSDGEDSTLRQFNKIDIRQSREGSVDVSGRLHASELDLNLQQSGFEDGGEFACDSLFVRTDRGSHIKLSGANLAKTKTSINP